MYANRFMDAVSAFVVARGNLTKQDVLDEIQRVLAVDEPFDGQLEQLYRFLIIKGIITEVEHIDEKTGEVTYTCTIPD